MSNTNAQRTKQNPGFHAVEDVAHGTSTAAWTSTLIIVVGAAVLCWSVVAASREIAIAGVLLCVIGVLAAVVLPRVGLGGHTFAHDD